MRSSKNLSIDVIPNIDVSVVVYRITEKQLFFYVDGRYCKECDITVRRIIEL
ncbi:MAG: hypothetical protein QQN63_12890 [Nitrosopumilus sp.]